MQLKSLLEAGVRDGVFPGAVGCVAQANETQTSEAGWAFAEAGAGVTVLESLGSSAPEPVQPTTIYDLASLTKPLVATAALRLAAREDLDLSEPVARRMPELAATIAGRATAEQLLRHRGGLAAWSDLYRQVPHAAATTEARNWIVLAAANQPSDGSTAKAVYSDLGYIVAGAWLERVASRPLDQLVRDEVTAPLGIDRDVFFAASLSETERNAIRTVAAPTEWCSWRKRLPHVEVHDENCAALGGISGHAGTFGPARSVARFGTEMLDVLRGRSSFLPAELLRDALAPVDGTEADEKAGDGHCYRLGWDTPSPKDGPVVSSAGPHMSDRAFGHLGFTGTSIWCDPEANFVAVLLSNRVHPTRDNIKIRAFRPDFHRDTHPFRTTI